MAWASRFIRPSPKATGQFPAGSTPRSVATRDLLAYLVRRLLENGANSSFVAIAGDTSVPVEDLLERPLNSLELSRGHSARHSDIVLPAGIYPDHRNSDGLEFGHRRELNELISGMNAALQPVKAVPLIPGASRHGASMEIRAPADRDVVVGTVAFATTKDVDTSMVSARKGFERWSRRPADSRAAALERAGDLLEENRDRLMSLLSLEAGKTLDDGIAEIREAVDFCRYYAVQARAKFSDTTLMPGPTGEEKPIRLARVAACSLASVRGTFRWRSSWAR